MAGERDHNGVGTDDQLPMTCGECGRDYRIGEWPFCGGTGVHGYPRGRQGGAVHPKERAVVYRHNGTGKVIYPPRNDEPMHPMYANAGYERHELPSLRDVEKLEKQDGVRSDIAWFDNGTGNADKLPDVKPIDLTGLEFVSK